MTGGPSIILVEPQLGENIGMVARAMLNCGLTSLSLVRPRDGWPNPAAEAAAAGANAVLDGASVYASTRDAVAGCRRVYATTARPRGMVKPVLTPRAAARDMRGLQARGAAVALLFGPERSGLTNDDLVLADRVIAVPLNPAFASLNLAQAVLIIGYEWFQAADPDPGENLARGVGLPAARAELLNFLARLERALDAGQFFHPPEKRAVMVRNLRNVFLRGDLTDAELRTLHGVVSALLKAKPDRAD
ncbi:MAG TPA: RNA methyltransferase [Acidobacteriota bacterium]